MFKLEIVLGNDAMNDPCAVAAQLELVVRKLRQQTSQVLCGGIQDDGGKILDDNGNTVGEWSYTQNT